MNTCVFEIKKEADLLAIGLPTDIEPEADEIKVRKIREAQAFYQSMGKRIDGCMGLR